MNKSKFLKKSLAALLSLMLIVAMIPVGAAADSLSFQGNGAIVAVTAENGTLTGNSSALTDTLTYKAFETGETLTVKVNENLNTPKVYATIGSKAEAAVTGNVITIASSDVKDGLQVVIRVTSIVDGEETDQATCTVTLKVSTASDDTTIVTAAWSTSELSSKSAVENAAYQGTISGNSITFKNLPWNFSGGYVSYVTGAGDVKSIDAATAKDNGIVVVSQHGNSDTYTVTLTEAPGLTSFSVNGVAATADKNDDGEVIEGQYTVELPSSTELNDAGTALKNAATVAYATGDGAPIHTALLGGQYDLSLNTPKSIKALAVNTTYTLVLTETATGETKTYTITVKIGESADNTIKSVTWTAGNYSGTGTVSGSKISVEIPYSTSSADVTITANNDNATVTIEALTKVSGTKAATAPVTTAELGKSIVVGIASENGKYAYYELVVTKAASTNNQPAINSAKLTFGTPGTAAYTEYPVTISGKTLTTTISYQHGKDANAGTWVFGKTSATNVSAVTLTKSSDGKKWTGKVVATSETGDQVEYSITVNVEAAKTEHALTKLTLSAKDTPDATEGDEYTTSIVTKSNKKTGTITVTLPYSVCGEGSVTLHASELAVSANATVDLEAGADSDDASAWVDGSAVTLSGLKNDASAQKDGVTTDVTVTVISEAGDGVATDTNSTVYTVVVKSAAPQTGHSLLSFTDTNGNVSSAISGTTAITVTVPRSYATDGKNASFTPVFEASKLATVTVDGVTVTSGKTAISGLHTGSIIEVVNEAGTTTSKYVVTLKVNALETGAELTSFTVAGVAATINQSAKTVTVTVPYGTNLRAVSMTYKTSTMAKAEFTDLGENTDDNDKVVSYNVSALKKITVKSEEAVVNNTGSINNYTVTIKVGESFSDVPASAWYHDNVMKAAEMGIVVGVGNGKFNPTANVTRGQFAVMIAKYLIGVDNYDAEMKNYEISSFSDVATGKYYTGAVAYLASEGIMNGDGGTGNFRPEATITRQEAASVLKNALGLSVPTEHTAYADDAKIAGWAKDNVYACKAAGVMNGDANGNFRPTATLTRAEAASVIVNAAK